jgi:hypothetical protein
MFLNTAGRMYSLSGAGSLTIEADTAILLFALGIYVIFAGVMVSIL